MGKINMTTYTIDNLEDLLDKIPYEIWLKDKNGKHIYINKLGAEKLGLSKEEIIGKTDFDIRPYPIANKCFKTDEILMKNPDLELYNTEESISGNQDICYKVSKFSIKNKTDDIILGGIAEEISLEKSIQNEIEKIMTIENNSYNIQNYYMNFLNKKLKALNVLLKSLNIDIFLYNEKDNILKLYMSADEKNSVFDKDSKIIINKEMKKFLESENIYYNSNSTLYSKIMEIKNDKYMDSYISKFYNLKIADNLFSLIHIHYNSKKDIKYKDDLSISYILKKICLLIFQIEKNNILFSNLEQEKDSLQGAIDFEYIKSSFFANISHEFRTPVNIILSIVQLLELDIHSGYKNLNQENYINYLNILKQNSYRLLRLVNNVVDTAKIDSNFFELDLSNYNIVKIVEDITMSTVKFIESKNKKIIFDTNSEEVILLCDPDKIERILLNLISNAVKFSFPNSVIRVNLFLNKKEERVYISVINDGNTITENESKKIFEQFTQSDNLFRRKTEGSGIGLFLAKYFIEMHNGKIWIELENKEAVEFKFYLPINIGTVIKDKKLYNQYDSPCKNKRIYKCNVEFSDIYDI
ncbi:PAS/PAC sensor domain-containing signal transduction histidine kinase [[Clostridium] sordellii]|uniref:histidine kinase n=1 Tax=Paraclostridium sordellii TaxID=1505 RepID=A0ABM9RTX6_PARSO|nr:HAMP domain-containing sensor histidine kinase [Paeniclostridium sordellii]CEJ75535.1 two-component sensor kinase (plasmid) [[Clostridium] sordellii] [Paeniclostridium sordellii]CEN22492.1 PAS/PAC sensor domain-containing signal transduction histidine kinase [[Clostridium] sordellii] [Paeniclostridium sordellii]CEN29703.1 PAS/PAC sensor domain-containing signal transduction histidine kinase [[Clostridium] sordellii] [Paeniclostridium sordellii]